MPVFSVLAYIWGEQYLSLGIYAAALVGGLMGFLIYNYNPAKVFMGDTGSLFLGGAIVALAFAYDMPLILIVLGLMYIIETLSDIIQVGYFKLSHGKRVFKWLPSTTIWRWAAGRAKMDRARAVSPIFQHISRLRRHIICRGVQPLRLLITGALAGIGGNHGIYRREDRF